MSDSTSIFIILFVIIFSLVAALLIFFLLRGINTSDKQIQKVERYQEKYQTLLVDIYSLDSQYPQGNIPDDVFEQLEAKKRAAAEILRLINPGLEENLSFYQLDEALGQMQARMDQEIRQQENFICQNCGSKVHGGDKFCANCGYRLHG